MYHSAFRTAQLMPITNAQTIPTTKTLSLEPLIPLHRRLPVSAKFRRVLVVSGGDERKVLVAKCSAAAAADSAAVLESCFRVESGPAVVTCMKKGGRGKSGSIGTLEKPKVEKKPKQEDKPSPPEPETGGDGGDIGKKIYHGGGDGGDDDGDDDYFDDFDDGDEGDEGGFFGRRLVFQELFGRKFVDAVLYEWQRTLKDLPQGLQQACQMGLVSSALMAKFLAMNARPTTTRFISRKLPQAMSRAFIGRMLADPAFLYRLLLEQAATIGCSVWWELKNRKERIKEEWDLALINVLTTTACNAIVVWSLAPCRSYGNTDLQSTLQLPNNIFEKSYPLREFDLQKRIQSFIYKAVELCMVGAAAGAAQSALSHLCASKKDRLSVTIPAVSTNSLGYGAFLAVNANLRYQLLCGVDRTMMNYFDAIGLALFFSTALRLLNVQIGETLRLGWLRIEADPLAYSNHHSKAYIRPSEPYSPSNWFHSKNGFVSGLGQGDPAADGEGALPKARRKRIVKTKVAS
ncbi:protein RETICULATA-RELATED 1, chloroplastic [Rhododendron vialii]|uniref:protein RETICULATA-RELATED 1, chloroplastic n=1 Tax=Rhododendron vialii TaxID=182163 RepID=UPI00265EB304|nr:protein RETICULATA-RELATED 1, chloroplastic [Rhododendron vialii]